MEVFSLFTFLWCTFPVYISSGVQFPVDWSFGISIASTRTKTSSYSCSTAGIFDRRWRTLKRFFQRDWYQGLTTEPYTVEPYVINKSCLLTLSFSQSLTQMLSKVQIQTESFSLCLYPSRQFEGYSGSLMIPSPAWTSVNKPKKHINFIFSNFNFHV